MLDQENPNEEICSTIIFGLKEIFPEHFGQICLKCFKIGCSGFSEDLGPGSGIYLLKSIPGPKKIAKLVQPFRRR